MRAPLRRRISWRVSAQRQHVPNADPGIRADHVPKLGDRVIDGGQVADRGEGGFLGDSAGYSHGAISGRAACPVRDGHEGRAQGLELANSLPEPLFLLLRLWWHELKRE